MNAITLLTDGKSRNSLGAWSKDGKTLTLDIRKNVKWSDGKPLTAADVVYSLTAGEQDKTMDIVGAYREGSSIASVTHSAGAVGCVVSAAVTDP